MEQHPELTPVQMDSVIGEVGGKVLLTVLFPCGMLLARLRDTNNSQSVIDYIDSFERNFGLDMFQKLFPVILTDNGSEFSNPMAIEFSPVTKERRTWVFYCEPNAARQKGNIENNHTNLRRILPRKTSFNALTKMTSISSFLTSTAITANFSTISLPLHGLTPFSARIS